MESIQKSENVPLAEAANPLLVNPLLVRRRSRETADTYTLELAPPGRNSGLHFRPGQFNMLCAYGVGEIPISISGDPSISESLTHTIRSVGAVSKALVDLKPGAWVGVRGPYGSSWPVEGITGGDIVIVAGGIGLAPLRPAILHILANRDDYGRVTLLYGARTPEEVLYRRELEKWRSRFDVDVFVTVDHATGDWHGHVGVVTTIMGRAQFDGSSCAALVCGPEIMMRFVVMALTERNVGADRIYVSMERNMKCGVGLCGHCQLGPSFVCKDGPIYSYDSVRELMQKREI